MGANRLNRRRFVRRTTLSGMGIAALDQHALLAQGGEATPDVATPVEGGDEDVTLNQTAAEPTELGPAVPPEFTDAETNWPTEHGNLQGTRAAAGSSISTESIGQLGVGWRLPLEAAGTYGAVTAAALVVGDTVYLQDMQSNIHAIDKESGDVKWTATYDIGTVGPNGLAVAYGRVYAGLGDAAEAVSVDAETGEEQWRVQLSNNRYEGIDIAPLVYDNIVYISTVPGSTINFYQGGAKGILYGLDAGTGHTLFQWSTTVDNLWGNFRVNSGGGLWHPPSVDENGNLFFSVANPAPFPGNEKFPNASSRPGPNDYTNSLVSLDPKAGALRWYINVRPHDLLDLDLHLSPVLATVPINGEDRHVAMSAGKMGVVIAADSDTGEELWRVPVGTHKNDDVQALPEDEWVETWPGNLGGVETPLSFSNGMVFAAVNEMPSSYNSTSYKQPLFDLTTGTGLLVALDASTGATAWSVELPTTPFGGTVVANDVVFTGGLDGVVRGHRIDTGEQVFTFQAAAGLNAPFSVSGDYLFVPAGGPFIASDDTADPAPETAQALIALKVGAGAEATPSS